MPSPLTLLVVAVSVLTGTLVYRDAQRNLASGGGPLEAALWGLGAAVMLPVFLPTYLLGGRKPNPSGTWGLAEMLGIAIFFSLSLAVVVDALGLKAPLTFGTASFLLLVQNLGFLLLSIFGVARRYRLPVAGLGLRAPRWPLLVLLGLMAGGLMLGIGEAAETAAIAVLSLFVGRAEVLARVAVEHRSDLLLPIIEGTRDMVRLGALGAMLGILVPLGEEVYFRGVVYGGLRRRWGVGWALTGSSVAFALVHHQFVHFLPILVLGVGLALLYERTGSLLPSIIVHGVNNLVVLLAHVYGWNI